MDKNIIDLIGNTPMVKIERLNPNKNVTILAKHEGMNPGGSIKDRIALHMITEAEKRGELAKDKIILEPTSGNTGIGIALVAAAKGYKTLFVMSEGVSLERRKILKAYGAQILLTPAERGTDGAIEKAYTMAREDNEKYYMPDQFNNDDNWKAHYNGTGAEIWEQTEGKVTHFIAAMGTTGTLMGTSRRLKEHNKDIRIIAVEPVLGHKIQGLKNLKEAYKPGIWNKADVDEKWTILDDDAYEMARKAAREEGLFIGMSAGGNLYSAIELAKRIDSGMIVTVLCDGGEKYLSTPLFGEGK